MTVRFVCFLLLQDSDRMVPVLRRFAVLLPPDFDSEPALQNEDDSSHGCDDLYYYSIWEWIRYKVRDISTR
jgi:hypothetical protein